MHLDYKQQEYSEWWMPWKHCIIPQVWPTNRAWINIQV